MKMNLRKTLALLLSLLLAFSALAVNAGAAESYTLVSPYEDVDWDTWSAYKGNLHTHSAVSDADESFRNMVFGAYNQGFDFIAFSEHGVTGRPWNEQPVLRLLYTYQLFTPRLPLHDDEFAAVTDGSYALDATGEARGTGMFCVTGANELNALTMSKSHVNGYFLPTWYGNANLGYENGFEYAIAVTEQLGGLSHINHPGDWLESEGHFEKVMDEKNVAFFADLLLRYPSCLGLESTNGGNGTTPYDRMLWDNLLVYCLPYGRTVYGFANSDAHDIRALDHAFGIYMMPETSMDSLRACMEKGQFFGVSRRVFATERIGPAQTLSAPVGDLLQHPLFDSLTVDGHKITVAPRYADSVRWIANGEILFEQALTGDAPVVLDLDDYDAANLLYVRCELSNDNAMTHSQPILIDRGTEPQTYEPDSGVLALAEKSIFTLLSARIFVLFQELVRLVVNKIADIRNGDF